MTDRLADPKRAAALFHGWEEAMIWACLQGVMGEVYGDDPERPRAAVASLGDFRFFAGEPSAWLVAHAVRAGTFCILTPRDARWADCIERYGQSQVRRVTRYATKKTNEGFDRAALRRAAVAPDGYTLEQIDETLYRQCAESDWCSDWVSNFLSFASYRQQGLGFALLRNGVPVSGASSYARYQGGVEVQIDTAPAYRRRGFAYRCGARLILACLERELYPSWDAQNEGSAALAEKLGYRYSHAYTAYEWRGPAGRTLL